MKSAYSIIYRYLYTPSLGVGHENRVPKITILAYQPPQPPILFSYTVIDYDFGKAQLPNL